MKQSESTVRHHLAEAKDAVLLFIDHQSAFMQTVESTSLDTIRNNVSALAITANALKIPVIATRIDPPNNGPLLPEIINGAPGTQLITRDFEINSWDNKEFVKAVKSTGRKTLIISGLWTSVCATFPALSAIQEGYTVYLVTDASGDITTEAHQMAVSRCLKEGIIPISGNSIIAELQKSWNRPDADLFRSIYAKIIPRFQVILEMSQAKNDLQF